MASEEGPAPSDWMGVKELILQAMMQSLASSTGWETLLVYVQVSTPGASGELCIPYQAGNQASQGHAGYFPLAPAPILYTQKWPHCKRMYAPAPHEEALGHCRSQPPSSLQTFVVCKMKTQHFFNLGILTMHFKICLPHGSKVLLCLWQGRRGGTDGPHEAELLSWSSLHKEMWLLKV